MSIKFYLIVAQRLPFCFFFFSFSKLNLEKMYNSSFGSIRLIISIIIKCGVLNFGFYLM